MAQHPTTGFDLDQTDHLLKTTKQVRKRLDLTRPVPHQELLDCIDVANHAPMGGNLERNRWMIIDDVDIRREIAERYAAIGAPYLKQNFCLLPTAYYTGDDFSPAPRRPAAEVTYLNGWKQPVE